MVSREDLLKLGNYPLKDIDDMIDSGYSPVIIGDSHELSYLEGKKEIIQKSIARLKKEKILVATEILPPIQLQYIRDFLVDEKEYREHGTIKGAAPPERLVEALTSYRSKLARNNSEAIALWLLDQGLEVICLEHDSALDWSRETDQDPELRESLEEFWMSSELIIRGYKDIKRDIHNLKQMNKKRPDIISCGSAHAEVYGILLDLNPQNMIFVPDNEPRFLEKYWDGFTTAHRIYSQLKY